jgi:hypothetical protein
MAYEHKEAKGTIFPNGYKKEDRHPDYKGKCLWNGELIEISLWSNETDSGETRFGFQISVPKTGNGTQKKPDNSPKSTQRNSSQEDDFEPIPF